MKLYSKKECPFCWQVKIALSYFELDYDLIETAVVDKAEILKISPQASVPVLVDENITVWDSAPALYYLEDISSSGITLFPGNESDRNKARLIHSYANAMVGPSLRNVIFEKRDNPENKWDQDKIKLGSDAWSKNLIWLENEIEVADNFITAGFSIADLALIPRFSLAEHYGVAVTKEHPNLFKWYQHKKNQSLFQDTNPWG